MSSQPICFRCLMNESDSDELARSIQDYISLIPDDKKAADALYSERLEVCSRCGSLANGMCGECGCFTEVRAAKKAMKCPCDKW